MSRPKAEFIIDEVAFDKILTQAPMVAVLEHRADEMVDFLHKGVERTGDNNPRRVRKNVKNAGMGYTHNADGYRTIMGWKDDGKPVAWVVSTQHFTVVELGTRNQAGKHYMSRTVIMFRA